MAFSETVPDDSHRPVVPDYTLLQRVGRGSYGEVWRGSSATGVMRAIKVVWRDRFENDRPFQREFEGIQRFERLSRLHSSQLALFHVGLNANADYFYYVMELADNASGQLVDQESPAYAAHTLRCDLQSGRRRARNVLELGLALTEALAHLHQAGLVHRDVKPSNIIFVNGRPKLADIGLVTEVGDSRSIVGTEGYLPPEGPGTAQADIYSLGKVLYEALTGMDRRDLPKLPPDMRAWDDRRLGFELNEVILKACAFDARQRYATADEMHQDLERLRTGKPIKTRSALPWRDKPNSGLVMTSVLFLLLAGIFIRQKSYNISPLSPHPQAVQLYKRAEHQLKSQTPERIATAYTNLTEAIRLDPQFARAYYQLLEVYWGQEGANLPPYQNVMSNLTWLANRMSKAVPNSAEYHGVKAYLEMREFHFEDAISEVQRAITLDHRWAKPHGMLGAFLLYFHGDVRRAEKELRLAADLDPTDMQIQICLGRLEYFRRDFKAAIAQFLTTVSLEPRMAWAHGCLAEAYEADEQYLLSLNAREMAAILSGGEESATRAHFARLRSVLEGDGPRELWKFELREAGRSRNPDYYGMGRNCARLGRADEMIQFLNQAYEQRDLQMASLLYDAAWEPWRDQTAFKELMQKVGYRLN